MEELKNIHREIANIPAEHLYELIRTSSAGARNFYVQGDSIFNTFCDL
jgi:hypothetical protein